MTSLLQAAAADVREAASYAPKEPMPMTNNEAIQEPDSTKKHLVALNHERVELAQDRYSRAEFLAMFTPASTKDFDLWRTVPGWPDEKVEGEWVDVWNGARFFTAPRYINGSQDAQSEPGPQRDCEAEIILTEQIAELQDAYAILDGIKCAAISDRRDAEQRALTLERALRLALDALDAKEAE